MLALSGTGVGRIIAIGNAIVLDRGPKEIPRYEVKSGDIQKEIERFRSAVERARMVLRKTQQEIPNYAPPETYAFIDVHLLMLEDPIITEQPVHAIKEHLYNAEWALKIQADVLVDFFSNIEDPYLRSKKNDVHQIVDRVLKELMAEIDPAPKELDDNLVGKVIIANDLTPADTVSLCHRGIAAFLTSRGGPISHTSILARSLGIPAIVGLHNAIHYIHTGDVLAIDSSNGMVLVGPDQHLLAEFHQRKKQQTLRRQQLGKLRGQPAITLDNCYAGLFANIELPEDIDRMEVFDAEGVGLYRTEFLFMNRTTPPDEIEQYETHRRIFEAVKGPVTVRTLDLGADKQVDGGRADGQTKINPALGLRAIRLCLSEPSLFKPQLRAILRASVHGQTRIMIPMLSSLAELEQALEIIRQVKRELEREAIAFDPNVPVGGMIEVPAAAISADLFAKKLQFLSIGTNDLIQYTLAIDRIDDDVNYLYDPLHPSVLRLIHNVICAGKNARIPVSMCGEMAGNPEYTRLLLGLGLREFSMEPSRLPEIKEQILSSKLERIKAPAQQILECTEPNRLHSLINQLNKG